MATIVHFRHPSSPATASAEQPGTADLFMTELESLQRRIGSYRRLIAECAAELYELELRVQTLIEAQTQLHELHGTQTETSSLLSQRETEVLRLAACGLRNAEIAELLTISVGTVKNYISAILDKLDVRSRWDAVIKARELALI